MSRRLGAVVAAAAAGICALVAWNGSRGAGGLLDAVRLPEDARGGRMMREGGALLTAPDPFSWARLPAPPSDRYRLTLVVERVRGDGSFNVGLTAGDRKTVVVLDAAPGHLSGLDLLDGNTFSANASTRAGELFPPGERRTVDCEATPSDVRVSVREQPAVDWTGDPSRLSLHPGWAGDWNLFIGSFGATFRVHDARVAALPPPP